MAKFTKGPWKTDGHHEVVTDYEPDYQRTSGFGCGNDFICALNDGEYHDYIDGKGEAEANANLIAAAPDMYELILEIVDKVGIYDEALSQKANNVITKATGK
jgi:hypothetical protein